MKNYILTTLLSSILLVGCMSDNGSGYDGGDEEEEEEIEELSEFGELVQDKFAEGDFPHECKVDFDNYDPKDFLTKKEFRLLELYMVFPGGYMEERYSARNKITMDNGITLLTVTSLDNENELSTYLVTYDEEEWYIDNVRIGYDESAEGFLKIYSNVDGDTITRTTSISFDGEEMLEVEHYYIQDDGKIIWEQDM